MRASQPNLDTQGFSQEVNAAAVNIQTSRLRSVAKIAPYRLIRPWRNLLMALILLSYAYSSLWKTPMAQAQTSLPSLGDTASETLSIGAEVRLGQQIMRGIRRDPEYLDDPLLLEYLQSLWQPLLSTARQQGQVDTDIDQRFAWEPFLLRDRSMNAFALPGGYMGVHLGLIAATDSREELASVLAHELSHITQRHIARGIDNNKQQSVLGLAAMILGAVAISRGNTHGPGVGEALIVGGQASSLQGSLNFSRDMEREADRIAFSLLTHAGFAPQGMVSLFEKLERASRFHDSTDFPYLRTHPLNAARIGEARARLATVPTLAGNTRIEHVLAQARARVLMDTKVDALRRWQALDKEPVQKEGLDRLATSYSAALASTLLKEWSQAEAAWARAARVWRTEGKQEPRSERWLLMLKAETMADHGDWLAAASALQPLGPDSSRPVMLLNARVAAGLVMTTKDPQSKSLSLALTSRTLDHLQSWLATSTTDATAWAVLAELWEALGQRLRSVRANAEVRYALGDLEGAVDRLRAAQRLPRTESSDFIELSVIDARLRSIEAQRRQSVQDSEP